MTLPLEFDEAWYHAPGEMKKYIDALLQSLNAERLRAEAAEAEVARYKEYYVTRFAYNVVTKAREQAEARAVSFAIWISLHPSGVKDHACARCVPNSDMLIEGFTCTQHKAIDTAIEQGAQHER